jgi:uncharacterized protein
MTDPLSVSCTAFEGPRRLLSGPLVEVVLAVKAAADRGGSEPILVFDDATGRVRDFDLRGTKADVVRRLSKTEPASPAMAEEAPASSAEPRGRGRPRLGVIGREVTLLPRHWEWLAAQPGGASVALRRLVDEARRSGGEAHRQRTAREAAYRFMSTMAGNFAGFEEASRALFAGDRARFEKQMAKWPKDLRQHILRLAYESEDAARA